jgi:3-oxoacid CoA-transferase subunit B
MTHQSKTGDPKLVRRCTLPLTAPAVVDRVVTDVGVFDVTPDGFVLREYAPGWTVEDIQAITDAPLRVAEDLREMAL